MSVDRRENTTLELMPLLIRESPTSDDFEVRINHLRKSINNPMGLRSKNISSFLPLVV